MIISRTPYRLSLFGGGTDYPQWYKKHGGRVLSFTIDRYLYITVRELPPFFDHRVRLVYSQIEECHSAEQLEHPAAREVLRFLEIGRGVEIHYDGDLPSHSGMGSSSAFTVGLLNALSGHIGREVTKRSLMTDSIYLEQEVIGEAVGSQDQTSAAYGGANKIVFAQDGSISIHPLQISPERLAELQEHLLLFFTRQPRRADQVAASYAGDLGSRHTAIDRVEQITNEAESILKGKGSLAVLGPLMNESWWLKRSLSSRVSNAAIDEIYQTATGAGALGGKLTGAGGGGMFLFVAPPDSHQQIKRRLSKLLHIPFSFSFTGSEIIFSDSSY